jgi:hypothetical protein
VGFLCVWLILGIGCRRGRLLNRLGAHSSWTRMASGVCCRRRFRRI